MILGKTHFRLCYWVGLTHLLHRNVDRRRTIYCVLRGSDDFAHKSRAILVLLEVLIVDRNRAYLAISPFQLTVCTSNV